MKANLPEWTILLQAIPKESFKSTSEIYDTYKALRGQEQEPLKNRQIRNILNDNDFWIWSKTRGFLIEKQKKGKANRYMAQKIEAPKVPSETFSKIVQGAYLAKAMMPGPLKALGGQEAIEHVISNPPALPQESSEYMNLTWQFSTHLSQALFTSNWGECQYEQVHIDRVNVFIKAIYEKRYVKLSVLSHNSSEPADSKDFIIAIPVRLYYHRGTLYFFVREKSERKPLLYELESIRYCTIVHELPKFKEDWNDQEVEATFNQRFGVTAGENPIEEIRLIWGILPKKKMFVEWRRWHSTQTFNKLPDGRLEMVFKSQINRELVGWIMMWLDHIKVLAPKRLADIVAKKAQAISQMYQEGKLPKDGNHPGDF